MTPKALRRSAQVLFWVTLAYVAFVTLSPIADRPVTPFGPDAERFGAFAVVSLLVMIGYPQHRLACFIGLVVIAGLLEAAQSLVDGRHGRLHDAGVKMAGVVAGTLVDLAITRVTDRSYRRRR